MRTACILNGLLYLFIMALALPPADGVEQFGNFTMPTGGKHGYRGVRKARKGGFQGYTPKKTHTTKAFGTAQQAAIARAQLKQDLELGLHEPASKKPRAKRGSLSASALLAILALSCLPCANADASVLLSRVWQLLPQFQPQRSSPNSSTRCRSRVALRKIVWLCASSVRSRSPQSRPRCSSLSAV